jgi:diacylglycerol kinase (ATP)
MSKTGLGISFSNRINSFKFAFKGLWTMFTEEPNFRVHFLAALATVLFGIFYELSGTEWILITIVIGFVLVSEIFNSAIERIADFVSPDHNKIIGLTKDLCAAMVLVAAVVAVIVGSIIFIPKF